ncbi:MAG: Maf family protein [Candidatus Anstonellaceae archaeon]
MGFVLASASPRRKRLLKKIVRKFSVKIPEVDERIRSKESFLHAAARLAELKAKKIAEQSEKDIVIGADTIAYHGKRYFRKTNDVKAARRVLRFLSGKTHDVVTGVAVVFPDGKCANYCERAKVRMKRLGDEEIAGYLKSGEWKGRAGCYDVSGKGRKLVAELKGERETVVGLPLEKLKKILAPYL